MVEDRPLPLTPPARDALIASADGDGRFMLNQAETLFSVALEAPLDPAGLSAFLQRRVAVYDKDREGHYNLISALHKSIRGSDPQAALYYLARMLVAGEEPLYVLRRLTRMASEDIGLADSNALVQCLAAKDAYDFLGSPERSEEHTSELQSLMRISYAVFCLKKKKTHNYTSRVTSQPQTITHHNK